MEVKRTIFQWSSDDPVLIWRHKNQWERHTKGSRHGGVFCNIPRVNFLVGYCWHVSSQLLGRWYHWGLPAAVWWRLGWKGRWALVLFSDFKFHTFLSLKVSVLSSFPQVYSRVSPLSPGDDCDHKNILQVTLHSNLSEHLFWATLHCRQCKVMRFSSWQQQLHFVAPCQAFDSLYLHCAVPMMGP